MFGRCWSPRASNLRATAKAVDRAEHRALTNLIDNAVKYGKTAHATINITPKMTDIIIDDEGPGIP
jgi:K+-sensing histidine kinase KdpD